MVQWWYEKRDYYGRTLRGDDLRETGLGANSEAPQGFAIVIPTVVICLFPRGRKWRIGEAELHWPHVTAFWANLLGLPWNGGTEGPHLINEGRNYERVAAHQHPRPYGGKYLGTDGASNIIASGKRS